MRSSRSATNPPVCDSISDALDSLLGSLERASADDPHSVEPVLVRLTALNRLLAADGVPPRMFQETRAAVDRAMLKINALLAGLIQARDEVGHILMTFNARAVNTGSALGAGKRLDLRT